MKLTPYRIATPEPIATKFRTIDYVRERTPKPNLVQIHPLGTKGVASMRQDEANASSCFRGRQIFAHLFHYGNAALAVVQVVPRAQRYHSRECECDLTLWQPVEQPTQWTCMSITQVKCDNMQTVLNNSVASHPRMNR